MSPNIGRRTALKGLGAIGFAGAVPQVSAEEADERFVVDTGSTVSSMDLQRLKDGGLEVVHDIKPVGLVIVRGDVSTLENLAYDFQPDIRVDIDRPVERVATESVVRADTASPEEMEIDSEHFEPTEAYSIQWDKHEQNLPDVHAITRGEGARVAIIDTGVYTHPNLENLNEALSLDTTGEGNPFADVLGHGTHVAGIVGARPFDTEGGLTGTYGTAPDAELVSVRYFDSFGFTGDFALAIVYSATPEDEVVSEELELTGAGCDVINTSLGTPPLPPQREILDFFEQVYQLLADYADSRDCVWASSAGNDATNATEENVVIGPAGVDRVLCVSATGPIGWGWGDPDLDVPPGFETHEPPTSPAFYTDHGEGYVDMSAPGGNAHLEAAALDEEPWYLDLVFNTYFDLIEGPTWAWLAGTSMAAPQVAGAAALLKSENPNMSANEVRQILKNTADDAGTATFHGFGFIDLLGALEGESHVEQRTDRAAHGGRDDRSRDDVGMGGGGSGSRGSGRSGGSGGGGGRASSR